MALAASAEAAAAPVPSALLIDPARIAAEIDSALVVRVRRLVEKYPDRALSVVRAWMAEGR